jgi:hypothetical protein
MPQGHRDPSRACTRASARASLNACTPSSPIGREERGPVTKNSRQVSGCGHDGRLRQTLEAFLINFITQLRHAGEAGHPQESQGSPYTRPQEPSARAVSFAMVCPATTRSADAQRYLDQLCEEGEEGHEKDTRLSWR